MGRRSCSSSRAAAISGYPFLKRPHGKGGATSASVSRVRVDKVERTGALGFKSPVGHGVKGFRFAPQGQKRADLVVSCPAIQ